jgi:hypothetical protein
MCAVTLKDFLPGNKRREVNQLSAKTPALSVMVSKKVQMS